MATDKGPVRALSFSLSRSPVTISGCLCPRHSSWSFRWTRFMQRFTTLVACDRITPQCHPLLHPMSTAIPCLSGATSLQATSQRRTAGTCIVVPKLHSGPPRSTRSRFWVRSGQVVRLHDQHAQLDGCCQALSNGVSNNCGLQLTTQRSAKPCPMYSIMMS
jgi:hypothetical protein